MDELDAGRQHHEAEVLEALARSLNASLDLDTVLQAIVAGAKDLCGSDLAALLLREPGSEAVVPKFRAGVRSARYDALRIEPGQGVGGTVLVTGHPFRTPDYLADPRISKEYRWLAEQEGIVSLLVVPIRIADRVEGLIYVDNRAPRAFTEKDERVLRWLADHAAIALRNAQLFAAEQAARAEAEAANRTKDHFLAMLSHELRTPLNAMLGWARLLRKGGLDAATAARALETLERNAQLQAQLIDDLLDVSRIITGKLRLDVRSLDLEAVVAAAVDAVTPAATAKGIRLDALVETSARSLAGDPDRLQQVVWNLLANAIKFTPKDGRVSVRGTRASGRVRIVVTDTGRGIMPDFLPYVFERFRQAESSDRRQGGLGLGLAIVRHLVELHGGTVWAESAGVDLGATFTVELPVASPPLSRDETLPALSARDTAALDALPPILAGVRVLLVDDEADARDLFSVVLEQCGADVVTAGTAAEAWEQFTRARPDVIVSDIGLPGEDGYVLIARVRALSAERGGLVPAIALTAFARAEDRRRALLAGFQTHLPKPVEPTELLMMVANLTGRPPAAKT